MIERVSFMFEKVRVLLFPAFVVFYRFYERFNCLFLVIAVVPYVFLWDFARETGARPARLDPRAHVQSLTAVLLP